MEIAVADAKLGPLVAAAGVIGCLYLFVSLSSRTQLYFLIWNPLGLAIYLLLARKHAVVR